MIFQEFWNPGSQCLPWRGCWIKPLTGSLTVYNVLQPLGPWILVFASFYDSMDAACHFLLPSTHQTYKSGDSSKSGQTFDEILHTGFSAPSLGIFTESSLEKGNGAGRNCEQVFLPWGNWARVQDLQNPMNNHV